MQLEPSPTAASGPSPETRIAFAMAELGALATEGDATGFEVAAAIIAARLADPALNWAFVRGIRAQIRDLELAANMKACDMALRDAFAYPKARRKAQRIVAVSSARFHLRRAAMLGASEEFLRAAERTIACALQTDGLWFGDAIMARFVEPSAPGDARQRGRSREARPRHRAAG